MGKTSFAGLSLCLLLAAQTALAGPDTAAAEFRGRREALMKTLKTGVILIPGAERKRGYDQFRQSNRFWYLSGLAAPRAAMVLLPGKNQHLLFLSPTPSRLVRWEGPGIPMGSATEKRYRFDSSHLYTDLPTKLNDLVGDGKTVIWVPFAPEEVGRDITDAEVPLARRRSEDMLDERITREETLREKLSVMFPSAEFKDLSPTLRVMRQIKSPSEILHLRKAAAISARGWVKMLRTVEPGMFEYQLGAIMAFVCTMAGGSDWPYWPIIGSGNNANVMHYIDNSRKTRPGDLVLMDAAYCYGYYACDITRTFPVTGKFTAGQRKIYEDLLVVQKDLVARVKPGASLVGLDKLSRELLGKKGYGGNIVHFLGHFLGMAVHDPGNAHMPLKPGMVITIEPGIYIPKKKIGFRIEDTVLVTEKGCEVLTAAVPKEVDALEKLMAGD